MSGALNVLPSPSGIAAPPASRPATSPGTGTAAASSFGEALQTAVDAAVADTPQHGGESGMPSNASAGTEQSTKETSEQTSVAPTADVLMLAGSVVEATPSNEEGSRLLADATRDSAAPPTVDASDGVFTGPETAQSTIPGTVETREVANLVETASARIAVAPSDADVDGVALGSSAAGVVAPAVDTDGIHPAHRAHPVASVGPTHPAAAVAEAVVGPPAAAPGRSTASLPAAAENAAGGTPPTEEARFEPTLPHSSATPPPFTAGTPGPAASSPSGSPSPIVPAPAPTPTVPLSGQIAGPLFSLAAQGDGEHVLTINVTPDNLGPVTVRAHISGEAIRIELFAPNDAGREALRGVLPDLRRDFTGNSLGGSLQLSSDNHPADQGDGQSARATWRTEQRNDRAAGATPEDHRVRLRTDGTTSIIDVMA